MQKILIGCFTTFCTSSPAANQKFLHGFAHLSFTVRVFGRSSNTILELHFAELWAILQVPGFNLR